MLEPTSLQEARGVEVRVICLEHSDEVQGERLAGGLGLVADNLCDFDEVLTGHCFSHFLTVLYQRFEAKSRTIFNFILYYLFKWEHFLNYLKLTSWEHRYYYSL